MCMRPSCTASFSLVISRVLSRGSFQICERALSSVFQFFRHSDHLEAGTLSVIPSAAFHPRKLGSSPIAQMNLRCQPRSSATALLL